MTNAKLNELKKGIKKAGIEVPPFYRPLYQPAKIIKSQWLNHCNKKAGQLITDKGAKRLNQMGNQANHQKLGQTPFENIKAKRKRNRKKKRWWQSD